MPAIPARVIGLRPLPGEELTFIRDVKNSKSLSSITPQTGVMHLQGTHVLDQGTVSVYNPPFY